MCAFFYALKLIIRLIRLRVKSNKCFKKYSKFKRVTVYENPLETIILLKNQNSFISNLGLFQEWQINSETTLHDHNLQQHQHKKGIKIARIFVY